MASRLVVPPAAIEWLVGEQPATVLVIGAGGGYPSLLLGAGHDVAVVDRDVARLTALAQRYADNLKLHVIAARGEALPFDPCVFDVVVSVQNFHTMAPGLALSEWARVLKPGGWAALAYLKRDDSIPWVKKLAALVHAKLPQAMRGDFGDDSMAGLDDSPYFPVSEERDFRLWAPCTRSELQAQARHATGVEDLRSVDRERLVEEVGRLYDAYAR
ncbi:MAG: class I SAM-dependent methyltransferase, partial [Propionibacteriaceae bacterium]|nr:class I SAM-dependent methyltransferase [Propionibacteriaceae bacterium]